MSLKNIYLRCRPENMMKLPKRVTKTTQAFAGLPQTAQLVIMGVLVFLAFTMGNCKGTDKMDQYITEYKQFKENAQTTTRYADSLQHQILELADSARKKDVIIQQLNVSVSSKEKQKEKSKTQLISLEQNLINAKSDGTHQVVIATQDTIIGNLKIQLTTTEEIVTDQKQIIGNKDEQLQLINTGLLFATQRGDSLQAMLKQLPPPPKNPNKFLGIPLPSRKTSLAVGVLAGIVVGVAVVR